MGTPETQRSSHQLNPIFLDFLLSGILKWGIKRDVDEG